MQDLFPKMKLKHRLIAWYFVLSLCSLCLCDEAPIWGVIALAANFGIATLLLSKVPLKDYDV